MKNLLFFIIVAACLFRIIYLFLIPSTQNPDEVYFIERTRVEATGNSAHVQKSYSNNEYFYPPFYFYASSQIVKFVSKPNKIDSNIVLSVQYRYLRFFNFLVPFVILFIVYKILKKLKLGKDLRLTIFSFFALLPSFMVFGNYPNPNILLVFLITLFFYVLVEVGESSLTKTSVISGIIAGLALLTKFEAIGLLIAFPAYYFDKLKNKTHFTYFLIFYASAFLVSGWWYLKNFLTTGWFYDKALFNASVANNQPPFSFSDYLSRLFAWTNQTFFLTYGNTNQIRLSDWVYNLIMFIAILSIVRLIGSKIMKNLRKNQHFFQFYRALAAFFVVNLAIFLYLNLRVVFQPQGRYLYPSLLFISISLVFGLATFFNKRSLYLLPIIIFCAMIFLNIWGIGCLLKYFDGTNLLPSFFGCRFYL